MGFRLSENLITPQELFRNRETAILANSVEVCVCVCVLQVLYVGVFLIFRNFSFMSLCSFGNPALDERSILAPLYQCCM